MTLLDVHQCPRCELRFIMRAELEDHLELDHGVKFVPMDSGGVTSVPPELPPCTGRVTIPVDPQRGPTLALDIGVDVARRAGMEVELVASTPPGLSGQSTDAYLRRRVHEAVDRGARTVLHHSLGSGDPAQLIADHVSQDTTLLAMATHGRGPVRELLLGSVSEAVLRCSPVPVLLLGPHAEPSKTGYERILVAVDMSHSAEMALDAALSLAGRLDVSLLLVGVLGSDPHSADFIDTTYLRRLANRVGVPSERVAWVIRRDRLPAEAILELADQRPDTIIAMGTHARTPMRRITVGSVAMEVVRKAVGPVMLPPALAAIADPDPAPTS